MPYRLKASKDGVYRMYYRKRFWHSWEFLAAETSRERAERVMDNHKGKAEYYIDYDDNGYADY